MPVLDRQFLKELLYHLVFTFVVITATFLVGAAVSVLHKVPGMKLSLFLLVSGFTMLQGMVYILPMSVLITVVMVYGRAASDNEFTTIKSGGVHPYRMLLPAFLVAVPVSGLALEVSSSLAPRSDFVAARVLREGETVLSLLESRVRRGEKSQPIEKLSLAWQSSTIRAGSIRLGGLTLINEGEEDLDLPLGVFLSSACEISVAPEGKGVHFLFEDIEQVEGTGRVFIKAKGLPLTYTPEGGFRKCRTRHYSLAELKAVAQRSEEGLYRIYSRATVLYALHERLALSMSSIVFVLIGVPLALVFRSGNRLTSFLLSFVIGLVVYYPAMLLAKNLGQEAVLPPILAAWSGNLLMLLLGLGLLLFVVRR